MPLTIKQTEEIFETALEVVYEDVRQNSDYLFGIVKAWLKSQTPEQQANCVSNDPDLWPDYFDFNPTTGEPWPEEEE